MSKRSDHDYGSAQPAPPSFEAARTLRQKARAAGMHPDHWYAVEQDRDLARGEVKEVVFWKRSIALFRDAEGEVHALENRCAHRQLKLSMGHVEGCKLVCNYHGWGHDGRGKVVDIPHETFGHKNPRFRVPVVPVQVRYGLIFVFPGDPTRAESVPLPELPQLEDAEQWFVSEPLDYEWKAHHSMILDNVSDYQHGYLHRRFQPFGNPVLRGHERDGDEVRLTYDAVIGAGKLIDAMLPRGELESGQMHLGYRYPYHWSNTDDMIRHFMFTLPIDEGRTRIFFVLYYRKFTVPFTRIPLPRPLMKGLLWIGHRTLMHWIFEEDRVALEGEQLAYERHWNAPNAELNPIVRAFQELTVRRWQDYLDECAVRTARAAAEAPTVARAG